MPRPQLVTAAGVMLIVVGANVALGGAALSVLLFRAPASPCLCLACPFAVMVLLAGLGCARVGWLVLARPFLPAGTVASLVSVAAGVGGLVAFVAGVFLANELPRFVRENRPRTVQYALEVGSVAMAFLDGLALMVAGCLLAVAPPPAPAPSHDSAGDPLPGPPEPP